MRVRKEDKKRRPPHAKKGGAKASSSPSPALIALGAVALAGAAFVLWPAKPPPPPPPKTLEAAPAPPTEKKAAPPPRKAEEQPPQDMRVGVVEEHHHVLPYYVREKWAGTLPVDGGATILHLDSHADMGVPRPPPEGFDGEQLDRYAEINDFLVLAAFEGLAEHLIFVEPPWSNQFRCCVYEDSATFDFAIGVDGANRIRVDATAGDARRLGRDRFGHIFWRDGEPRVGGAATLSRVRHFRVSVVFSELADMPERVVAMVDASKPFVLDVDLDYFATESIGAVATRRDYGVDDDALSILYHLTWNFPDMGLDFLRSGRTRPATRPQHSADTAFDAAARAATEAAGGARPSSSFAEDVAAASRARGLAPARRRRMEDFAATLAGAHAQPRRTVQSIEMFLEQPFHAPAGAAKG